MKIYCPLCYWEPSAAARWICRPGCDHVWNTFDTGGVCPGCLKWWQDTACLACHRWSKHKDWYHDDGLPIEHEQVEEVVELML